MSPGSTSISSSSAITAVTFQSALRSTRPSVRSTGSPACGSRSSSASWSRSKSERWSSIVGSASTRWRFWTAGRRITWRPTPTSAAFGRVCSGGTSITRSPRAGARHASRQPARSSSALNARGSTLETGTSPSSTRTLHFLHVPWPPQVESIAMPFQLAASNTGVPLGTRTSAPSGSKRSRTRSVPSSGAIVSSRVGSRGLTSAARASALRARCVAIQRAPHGSWPSSRSAARTSSTQTFAVLMIALVSPAAIAIGRNAAFSACRSGSPNDTFDAPSDMFTPRFSRISRIASSVIVTASVAAPTVIASGSIRTSSGGMP